MSVGPRKATNEARAERGTAVVNYYGRTYVPEPMWYEDAVDAVADILHACETREDARALLDDAWDAFDAESKGTHAAHEPRRLGLGDDRP